MVSRLHLLNETKMDISPSKISLKEQLILIASPQYLMHQNMVRPSTFQSNSHSSYLPVKKLIISCSKTLSSVDISKNDLNDRNIRPDKYQRLSSNLCGPLPAELQTDIKLSDSDIYVDIIITVRLFGALTIF